MVISNLNHSESVLAQYVTLMGTVVSKTERRLRIWKLIRVMTAPIIALQLASFSLLKQPAFGLVISNALVVLYLAYTAIFGYRHIRERVFLNTAREVPVTHDFFHGCAEAFGVERDAARHYLNTCRSINSNALTFADVLVLRYLTIPNN